MDSKTQPAAKIHPATREVLPDDPLELHGFELPGDPDLMLRLLVEEFARIGFDSARIKALACDPNYQAFGGLLRHFGADVLCQRIEQILARCGVLRVQTREAPLPSQLVQIELP